MENEFKDTEIGKIPVDWEILELKNVSDVIDSLHKTPKYCESGYPMVRVTDISKGYLNLKNAFNVSKDVFDEFNKKYEPKKGDIVFSRVGSYGISSYVNTDEKFCLGQNTVVIIPKFSEKYLYYTLNSDILKTQIESTVTGSTQKTISLKDIRALKIPIPPLEEQQKIAEILSALDDKIENNNQQNKILEETANSIFKEWFINFNFSDDEGKPYFENDGEMEFNEELGIEIPKGWKVGKLGDFIVNFDSKRIPLAKLEREKRKGNYPYYGAASVMDYVDDYIFDGTHVLLGEDGTVIDELGYPVLQYVWGKFWVNNHAHVLKGIKGVSEEYIYILLKNTNVKTAVTGAVQPKINQNNMNNLEIIKPPINKIMEFSEQITPLFNKLKCNLEENQNLSNLRDLLLPKLMSGQIRLK